MSLISLSKRSLSLPAVRVGIAIRNYRRHISVFDGWVYFGNAGGLGAGFFISSFLASFPAEEDVDLVRLDFLFVLPEVVARFVFSDVVL